MHSMTKMVRVARSILSKAGCLAPRISAGASNFSFVKRDVDDSFEVKDQTAEKSRLTSLQYNYWKKVTSQTQTLPGHKDMHEIPIIAKDGKFVPNPEFTGVRPLLQGTDYVDSTIKFENVFSEGLGICFTSDYDLTESVNSRDDMLMIQYYFPTDLLNTRQMVFSRIDETIDFFEHQYPLAQRFKDLLNPARIAWVHSSARTIVARSEISRDLRNTSFIVFCFLIIFDDYCEKLLMLGDNLLAYKALRHNAERILCRKTEMIPKIDLRKLHSFPKELLQIADLYDEYFDDLVARIMTQAGPEVMDWFAKAFIHFQDGVSQEPDFCQRAMDGSLDSMSENGSYACRSRSIGSTVANAVGNTASCVRFLSTNDPILRQCEMALSCESDASTYFKEREENIRNGAIVNANTMDYLTLVKGLTPLQALKRLARQRNRRLKNLQDTLTFIDPSHRQRYWAAVRSVVIFNDYSFIGGHGEENFRYGWYATSMTQRDKSLIDECRRNKGESRGSDQRRGRSQIFHAANMAEN